MLLNIYCFMYLPLFVGILCWSLFLCPFKFCNHHDEEERTGCLAFIVFLVSCCCKCAVALPHGAVG